MKHNKAIVTLVIGQQYQQRWNTICANNWQYYADKHGYDLICIDKPLDNSARAQSRSPAWQKCLILGDEKVKNYERIVWIDSDILINPHSPCIVSQVPEDKVGAASTFHQFDEQLPGKNQTLMNRAVEFFGWSFHNAKEYYLKAQFPDIFDRVVQTGVMVLSPKHHQLILEYTYHNYQDTPVGDYEMESLSYELLKTNSIHWLDDRFNKLWIVCMLMHYPFLLPPKKTEIKPIRVWKHLTRGHYQLPSKKITTDALTVTLTNNYFLHFAGMAHYMHLVKTNKAS